MLTGIIYWLCLCPWEGGMGKTFKGLGLGQAPKCPELRGSKSVPSGSFESNSSGHVNSINVSWGPKVLSI